MNILVLNSGSSSIKYKLIEMPSQNVKCGGIIERLGMKDAIITHKKGNLKYSKKLPIKNHKQGLHKIETILTHHTKGAIKNVKEIEAVGHRVVHGGSKFKKTVIATDEVKKNIRDLFYLAPLHNPENLIGIEIAETIFTSAKQIAIFDTAFHQTIPKEAYQYAIPNNYLDDYHIRAYGFHGTSHKYVSEKATDYLGNNNNRIITIHLGNGCSISAIKEGKSIENSLGFGPMNGLIMGTRAGDIDQSVILYLKDGLKKPTKEINHILQKESGMKGLTGFSDLREIENLASKGDEKCINALKLASYRIKKYIGSYIAVLNGVDAIVFTAGIGENSNLIRQMTCANLNKLGIELDIDKNLIQSKKIVKFKKMNLQ